MRCRRLCGGRAGLRGWPRARSQWNADPGEGAGQPGTCPEPSGFLQWLPEAVLAWWRIDDGPADRTWVEVLADPPELLAWAGGDAGHRVDDRVPRAEGGLRQRGSQRGRRLAGHVGARTEQRGEQAGLAGEHRERAQLSWLTVAGDDNRAGQARAADARLRGS